MLVACLSTLLAVGIAAAAMVFGSRHQPDSITYNGQTYLRSEYPHDTGGLDLAGITYADRGTFVGSLRGDVVESKASTEEETGSTRDVFEFDADNALLVGTESHNCIYVRAEIPNE